MKQKEAFQDTISLLRSVYEPHEASSIARLVFEDLDMRPLMIFSDPEVVMSSEKLARLKDYITRLLEREPVQYVLGYAWFRERKFFVNSDCLIPRQETEQLVEHILEEAGRRLHLLDIGTGSGCIPVSLSAERPEWKVEAMDINSGAIKLAKRNAKSNHVKVKYMNDNILQPDYSRYADQYDIIVSNPPYVRESERSAMDLNVLDYEPDSALFVPDNNALVFYYAIREFSLNKLKKGGKLFLEINEALGVETRDVFLNKGFSDVVILKDIHGRNRFIKAKKDE